VAVEALLSQMAVGSADPDIGSARDDFCIALPLNLSCAPPQPGARVTLIVSTPAEYRPDDGMIPSANPRVRQCYATTTASPGDH
jgi:hypothetical protein